MRLRSHEAGGKSGTYESLILMELGAEKRKRREAESELIPWFDEALPVKYHKAIMQ